MPTKSSFRQRLSQVAKRVALFVFAPCYWIMWGEFKPPVFVSPTSDQQPINTASMVSSIRDANSFDEEYDSSPRFPPHALQKEMALDLTWMD